MGGGILIYFGYPQAHEDDAERATRCGLALVDRVPQLDQAQKLHARVGVATGLVVGGGELALARDDDGEATWRRIMGAVTEFANTTPPVPVH
jgi:class 3 adenylate cyclase